MKTSIRGRTWFASLALVVACISTAMGRAFASVPEVATVCEPLTIEPMQATIALRDIHRFRMSGGSGRATFGLPRDVDTGGSSIEPGGAFRAGEREASFEVIARDDACGATATARVRLVAPLEVEPKEGRVEVGGMFHFAIQGGAGSVHARLLGDPRGATLGDDGVFVAPAHEGRWQALVTDSASSREVVVAVDVVAKIRPFRALTAILAVPAGGRAPLFWNGGSGSFDVTLTPAAGARIERDSSGRVNVTLDPSARASIDARAVDRVTHEEAHVRVLVAPPLGHGGDHAGSMVAFAPVGARVEAFVADDPMRWEASRIERFELPGAATGAPIGRRDPGRIGASAPVAIDFDGDGSPELAIADLHVSSQPLAQGEIDPDGCLARPNLASVGGGVIHIYASVGNTLVERARVVTIGAPGSKPDGFGAAFAVADVNGDHRGDVVVGRRDKHAVEIVLGRPFVHGKVLIACRDEKGARASFAYPPEGWTAGGWWGERIASIGDVDRDGCDEVAFTAARDGIIPIGIIVVFGYDAGGTRCHGHARPLSFVLVSSDREWSPDPSALFDWHKPRPDLALRRTGSALASGEGDLTGDGVPDLAFGDAELDDETGRGPAVEIVSGAFLASICPDHVCSEGGDVRRFFRGADRFVSLAVVRPEDRVVVRGPAMDRRFGEAILIADLDGDHHAELAVGAPEGCSAAPFAGDVSIFKGPLALSRGADREPWFLAVGDSRERSAFGASIAAIRAGGASWLLVGAPRSARRGKVVGVGAAYLFRLDGRGE